MIITLMTIDDYDDVYALWIGTPGMGLNDVDDSREGIQKYLARNPRTCFVARAGDRLIGVILSGHDGRRGFIHHLAVAAPERRKGVGKGLVQAALTALCEEGIHKVAFVVFRKNQAGNEFWEKLGFEERQDLIYRNKPIGDVELKRMDT